MLSARPYLQGSVEHASYAQARLRGTIWEHVGAAHAAYRALMAVGWAIGRAGISANSLTYASLLFAAGAGVVAAFGQFLLAAGLVITSGLLDVLDGVVARATGTESQYGALLDSTVDRLSDGLPLLGIAVFYGNAHGASAVPIVAMLGGFTVSYVRARSEALGVKLPALFMRRAERVLWLAFSLLLGSVSLRAPVAAPLLLAGLSVGAVLNLIGAGAALRAARNALSVSRARASTNAR
jgi:CDP-diacylglycerol---glycerol-3-phosphate 3-phosphatidyltransferase